MEVLTSSVATTGRVQIVADDRERQSAVYERLANLEEVNLQVRRLEVGDYERQRVQVLAALPGVGGRARSLLEHFGSIEAVMLAGEEELVEVPEIGPHTAGHIRKVVGATMA